MGISLDEFRANCLENPDPEVLAPYSRNPRNAFGDWYEDHVGRLLETLCSAMGLVLSHQEHIGPSRVYLSEKVVDVVVRDPPKAARGGRALGLELKFLSGTGSLVQPKSIVDAIDFTSRPIYCMYCIDGEGWLRGRNVEYLSHWWDFTCARLLERTLGRYFA